MKDHPRRDSATRGCWKAGVEPHPSDSVHSRGYRFRSPQTHFLQEPVLAPLETNRYSNQVIPRTPKAAAAAPYPVLQDVPTKAATAAANWKVPWPYLHWFREAEQQTTTAAPRLVAEVGALLPCESPAVVGAVALVGLDVPRP